MGDNLDKNLKSLIPGALSTSTSVLLGYPIDTIKTRMQTGMHSNFFSCLSSTAKNEGIKGFYRGVSMPFATLLVKRTLQFRIYEEAKKHTNSWLAGTCASIVSPISNPMHVVKVRMQNSKSDKYKSMMECIKDVYKTNGIRGFFKGTSVNLVKDVSFGTLYLGSYGTLKKFLDTNYSQSNKEIRNFIAGGTAGSLSWLVLMPIDYVKTAYQTGAGKQYVFSQLGKNGIKALWKGVIPTVGRIFPINAAAMTVYEFAKDKVSAHN